MLILTCTSALRNSSTNGRSRCSATLTNPRSVTETPRSVTENPQCRLDAWTLLFSARYDLWLCCTICGYTVIITIGHTLAPPSFCLTSPLFACCAFTLAFWAHLAHTCLDPPRSPNQRRIRSFMLPVEGLLLPPTSAFFPADKAEPDPYLYRIKDATNAVKSKLDSKAIGPWRNHTKLMLHTSELTQAIRQFNVLCSPPPPHTRVHAAPPKRSTCSPRSSTQRRTSRRHLPHPSHHPHLVLPLAHPTIRHSRSWRRLSPIPPARRVYR